MTPYEKISALCKPYLGPATEQFLARQCRSHLKIEALDVKVSELGDLAKWVEISAALIMDNDKAAELAKKILAVR